MKKIIFIFILVILTINLYSVHDTNKKLLKRNLLILPFFNQYKIEKYDYISSMIFSNLKRILSENFNVIESEEASNNYIKLLDYNRFIDKIIIEEMSLKANADSVLYGEFFLLNEKDLTIKAEILDVITGKTLYINKMKFENNYDMPRYLNEYINLISENTIEKFTSFDSGIIKAVTEKNKLSKTKKNLVENLLSQQDVFWNYKIKIDNIDNVILIPFAKNVIIFACLNSEKYTLETGSQKIESKAYITYYSEENNPGKTLDFNIYYDEKKNQNYKYTQKSDYEINIKYFKIKK